MHLINVHTYSFAEILKKNYCLCETTDCSEVFKSVTVKAVTMMRYTYLYCRNNDTIR